MAGGKERVLRRRIKSVQTTKKITKAMELIAASRIVKSQQRVLAARPYADQITEVIRNLAAAGAGGGAPLLAQREQVDTVATIVVGGDRGLCGGYNANAIRMAERNMAAQRAEGKDTALFTVGRKIESYFRFRKYDIVDSFTGFLDEPHYEDARRIAEAVVPKFEDGTFDRVDIVYTQFLSAGTQQVVTRQFLPLDTSAITETTGEGPSADYEFEPSPDLILDRLLPRYAEARLFSALLEGAASFFAAQQRAMKSATDNAEELIVKLSRAMNRARQDSITTEIMEIVGGAEALRQGQTSEMDLIPDHALGIQDLLVDVVDYRHH
ncbi:MAG TPA: F0F1 ATP synthase subunit gamma [Acidimicrobiales bacterium]|nr:F0F1 ATP synthase subunit gamma [Acidimicrobiales bacterium]